LTNRIPPPPKPAINRVEAKKKYLIVEAVGIVSGSTVVVLEGNRALTDYEYEYDDAYKVANGTYTRVKIKLGKSKIKEFFPPGSSVGVGLHNVATDEWSGQVSYDRD
jgi:hypothetical protein